MMDLILNKKDSLRKLSDEEFEKLLPTLSGELESLDFAKSTYSEDELVSDWNRLKKYSKQTSEISSTVTTGTKLIRHFMPNIYDVQNFKGKSIRNSWTSENLKKALRFNRKYHSTPYLSEIIRSLGFVSGLANVTIYKPITTHSLITKLSSKTVLDFCVGWGGRMIGTACRADRHYIGIEPNVETYGNLCRLRDFLQLKNVELINDCAENVVDSIDGYDTTLTSPPYYNLEIYCDEKTQSINLGTYSEWLDKFIFKLINSSFDKATYYCWSVKNFKTDKQYNLMDDITNHYASRGGNVVCKYDIKNKQRPGVKRKEKNTSEQTLVFSKNTHIINPPHMFFVDI